MEPMLAQRIEATIRNTEILLCGGKVTWPTAREGVTQILEDLVAQHPEHSNAIRSSFERWMKGQDEIDQAADQHLDDKRRGEQTPR
jgi:hypothetical protein